MTNENPPTVKVGDVGVVSRRWYGLQKVTVTRVLKKYFEIDDTRQWRLKDSSSGIWFPWGGGHTGATFRLWKPEDDRTIQVQDARRLLAKMDVEKLTDDQAVALADLLTKLTKEENNDDQG